MFLHWALGGVRGAGAAPSLLSQGAGAVNHVGSVPLRRSRATSDVVERARVASKYGGQLELVRRQYEDGALGPPYPWFEGAHQCNHRARLVDVRVAVLEFGLHPLRGDVGEHEVMPVVA
eukprot:6190970-Pyramimonas_sp.AAC.1